VDEVGFVHGSCYRGNEDHWTYSPDWLSVNLYFIVVWWYGKMNGSTHGGSLLFRLLTPPRTPLFTSLELESQKTAMSQIGMSNARPTALKSRVRSNLSYENAFNPLWSRAFASMPSLAYENMVLVFYFWYMLTSAFTLCSSLELWLLKKFAACLLCYSLKFLLPCVAANKYPGRTCFKDSCRI
jgi:hypothetical protein